MNAMKHILLILTLLYAFVTHSQVLPPDELPLPRLKGVKMVVVHDIHLESSTLYKPDASSDTSAVYLMGNEGLAHTEYSYSSGIRNSKRVYVYEGNNLATKMTFEKKGRGSYFQPLKEDSMILKSKMELTYQGKQIVAKRYYCCKDTPGLTEETFFAYDKQGRVGSKVVKRYTVPGGLYWGSQKDDSTLYHYINDSVYVTRFEGGAALPVSRFYQKMDGEGRLLDYYDQTADGLHFERVTNTYDPKGRLLERRYQSDRPAVQPDGIVLSADKIVYRYDDKGRLKEEVYAAEGKDRWKSLYIYIE